MEEVNKESENERKGARMEDCGRVTEVYLGEWQLVSCFLLASQHVY